MKTQFACYYTNLNYNKKLYKPLLFDDLFFLAEGQKSSCSYAMSDLPLLAHSDDVSAANFAFLSSFSSISCIYLISAIKKLTQ